MKSVVILAYAFPPENTTGANRPHRFYKFLPAYGYQPHVVAARPDLECWDRVRRVPGAVPRRKVRAQAAAAWLVERFALPFVDFLPWIPHAVDSAREVMRHWEVAAVVSTFPPTSTHLAALWLKLAHGVRWIADFRDPLVGNPFRVRRWPIPYSKWVEAAIFRHADAVIANTDSLADEWRERYPFAAAKIRTIWNGFDPESPLKPIPLSTRRWLHVAHLGTLYGGRHPRVFLESLERLLDCGLLPPDAVRVELTGPVEQGTVDACGDVLGRMRRRGVVDFTPTAIPQQEAGARISDADILLMLDINGTEQSIQVPAKLFEYARVDRPILVFTTRDSPLKRILAASGIDHVCVELEHIPQQVDDLVLGFLLGGKRVSRANDWFWSTFDGRKQTAQLADAIAGRAKTDVLEPGCLSDGAAWKEPDTMVR